MGRFSNFIWFSLAVIAYLAIQMLCLFYQMPLWIEKNIHPLEVKPLTAKEESDHFWEFKVEDFALMLKITTDSREYVRDKEEKLNKLEAHINRERESLLRLKKEIQDLQDTLSEEIITIQNAEQKNLKTLATTYTNMEPEAVVKVFDELDNASVVKLMHFIAPESLGAILQVMAGQRPEKGKEPAKRVSQLIETFRLSKMEN